MLIAVNQMKTSQITVEAMDMPWTTIDITISIPNLKLKMYDPILRALGWRPENTLTPTTTSILIPACGVICASNSFIMYVGGYMQDIMAYTYDVVPPESEIEEFVSARLVEILQAKAALMDVRHDLSWNSLVSYFERQQGFDTNDKNQLVYRHSARTCTVNFPVISRLNSTEHLEVPIPKINQVDFQDYMREAFGAQLTTVIGTYFIQQMAIASNHQVDAEDKTICYRYLENKESVTGTSVFYLGFEYELPGNPAPVEVFLVIDQSAVDLNTGKLNKMSEIILRSV